MTQVRELMTPDPEHVSADDTLVRAAQLMRDADVGSLPICDADGQVTGIVTDRDIVVRGVADFDDLSTCSLGDVCSDQLLTASPDDDVDTVISRMREGAVRRIPVVEGDKPVGVLSIGDAAIDRDSRSALADISAEEGNT